MSRKQKKWMKILKKAKNNAELYKKYKYNYLKQEDSMTTDMCSRGCNRRLTDAEAKAPNKACYHCLRDNTFNKIRCNGCDEILLDTHKDKDQLCGECRDYTDKTTKVAEDNASKSSGKGTISTTTIKTTPTDLCTHRDTPFVFSIGKGDVYAGGSKSSDAWTCLDKIDFILRLTGTVPELVDWNKSAEAMFGKEWLSSLCTPIPTVGISWQDMGAPPFGRPTVEKLVKTISEGKSVLVHCVGGHGRTGTMLAALAHVAGIIPEEHKAKPIHWLRKLYCAKAVESLDQREWLVGIGALAEAGSYSDYNSTGGSLSTWTYKWCAKHSTGLEHDCDLAAKKEPEAEVKQTSSLTPEDVELICEENLSEEEMIQIMMEGGL